MAARDIAFGASGFQQDRFLAGFSMAEIQSGALLAGTRLEGAAQEVALLKAEAVCGVMLWLAALRVHLRGAWIESSIDCTAARVQLTNARSEHGMARQAAHLLPGNLVINGRSSWEVAEAAVPGLDGLRLSGALSMAFAETLDLPACFNVADSKAEGGVDGLKPLFAAAVRTMGRLLVPDRLSTRSFRAAIETGLRHWFTTLSVRYAEAERDKRARAAVATGAVKERRLLEARVLAEYHRSTKIANPLRVIDAQQHLRSACQHAEALAWKAV